MKKITSPFKIIKSSFEIFTKKENFLYFSKIYLPIAILSLISLLYIYIPFLADFFKTPAGNIVMSVYNFIFALVGVFVSLTGVIAIINLSKSNNLDVKNIYKSGFSLFWKFLIFTIVTFLIYGLGFVLIIIPFILTVTWFVFAKFIFIEKKLGLKKSLIESKNLVKGRFWKVFIRIFVFALFAFISQTILTSLPYGVGVVIYYLCGALFTIPYFLLYKELSSDKTLSE